MRLFLFSGRHVKKWKKSPRFYFDCTTESFRVAPLFSRPLSRSRTADIDFAALCRASRRGPQLCGGFFFSFSTRRRKFSLSRGSGSRALVSDVRLPRRVFCLPLDPRARLLSPCSGMRVAQQSPAPDRCRAPARDGSNRKRPESDTPRRLGTRLFINISSLRFGECIIYENARAGHVITQSRRDDDKIRVNSSCRPYLAYFSFFFFFTRLIELREQTLCLIFTQVQQQQRITCSSFINGSA